jgi:hypothetical protein
MGMKLYLWDKNLELKHGQKGNYVINKLHKELIKYKYVMCMINHLNMETVT